MTAASMFLAAQNAEASKSVTKGAPSIAAVIANEFAEANGQLYISSLIFMALVLFGLTIIINAVARIFIMTTQGKGA